MSYMHLRNGHISLVTGLFILGNTMSFSHCRRKNKKNHSLRQRFTPLRYLIYSLSELIFRANLQQILTESAIAVQWRFFFSRIFLPWMNRIISMVN